MRQLDLIPMPRTVRMDGGGLVLASEMYVVLEAHPAAREVFGAERFIFEVGRLTGIAFHLVVGPGGIDPAREIRTHFDAAAGNGNAEGYRLTISKGGIDLAASTAAGTFYALQTLLQIVRAVALPLAKGKKRKALELPSVTIEDWPDFARRGVYHDCARGKVPKVGTLLQLIDDLGHLKYNEFQLYVENAFEFRRHPEMYDDTTPLTAEDLLLLDGACKARHMDFVPSLTSLGHFEKILTRPAFAALAEAQPAELRALGAEVWVDAPWSLCVTDPAAQRLLKDMYDEFLPNFTSGQINICCDEAYDLGKVRSKDLAAKIGTGQLYVNWVRYCTELARGHGKTVQMWGDIILKYPELIGQLPDDAVLLEWGYEADHKFEEHCALFAERLQTAARGGRQSYYVCPGTSSWLTLASRTKNAFGNIRSGAAAGLKHGAAGVLVTDWGDNGHQQMLAVSLTAFAYGAAAAWNGAAAADSGKELAGVLRAISLHLFQDPAGDFARATYDLGLTYERFSWQRFNASLEWYLFREKWDFANYVKRVEAKDLPKVIGACEKLRSRFEGAELAHPEGELIRAELALTCDEVIHACERTALRKEWLAQGDTKPAAGFKKRMKAAAAELARLEKRYGELWLARNNQSRLEDVLGEFRRLREEYAKFGG